MATVVYARTELGGAEDKATAAWLPAGFLFVMLAIHLPAFVRMEPDCDATHYDLCVRTVLQSGGVLYRDAFETNPPGMPWCHLLLRSLFGWRPEVMRLADLGVVALIILVLIRWLPEGSSTTVRWLSALVLSAFYLSTSEWCHVQRDVWMLLPSLLALGCRWRQLEALRSPHPLTRREMVRPLVEGLLWGAAFWIKPFVAIPALVCWLSGAWSIVRLTPQWKARLAGDAFFWLLGGSLAGAGGIAWLVATGAWPSFWEIMWIWNREYASHSFNDYAAPLVILGILIRFFPWSLLPLFAIPIACREWRRAEASSGSDRIKRLLLSALYLGWFLQVVAFQNLFDYVYAPLGFLTLIVLCRHYAVAPPGLRRTILLVCLLLPLALRLPSLTIHRAMLWSACINDGSSAELRARLSLFPRMSSADLARVEAFLRQQNVRDGEVACWAPRSNALYADLGIRPPTRYLLMHLNLRVFVNQRERMWEEIAASPQRFVVCDTRTDKWKKPLKEPEKLFGLWALPCESFCIPQERLVFRAGRYVVYAVDAKSMRAWIEANHDL